jgi:predicted deacylase
VNEINEGDDMPRTIQVGTAVSTGGDRADGYLKTAELPDGQPINIPITIIQGTSDGPTLWLHGCVHGNEFCGSYTIHEFMRGLDPQKMRGAVVGLPFLNLTASQRNQRMSPFEGYNIGDLNRCFPGRADGSLTEQIGHAIWTQLRRHATHLVDFHTAYTPDTRWALYADAGGKVSEQGLAMARAFGYAHTLPTPMTNLRGSAMIMAAEAGIPSFIVEAGGIGPAFSMATVKDSAARLRNVARAIGIVDEPVVKQEKLTLFSNFHWCNSRGGGLFRPSVKCGQKIKKGERVGTFYDIWGDIIEIAKAPASGIVLAIHPGPVMPQGETLVHIGLDPRADS